MRKQYVRHVLNEYSTRGDPGERLNEIMEDIADEISDFAVDNSEDVESVTWDGSEREFVFEQSDGEERLTPATVLDVINGDTGE